MNKYLVSVYMNKEVNGSINHKTSQFLVNDATSVSNAEDIAKRYTIENPENYGFNIKFSMGFLRS